MKKYSLPLVLLCVYLVAAISSLENKASVYDEHPHIVSGYSYLQTGKFTGGLDNPPLLQLFFVLPAWLSGHKYVPYVDDSMLWFRIPAVSLGVALGLVVWLWSMSLFGESGALLSLALYVFSTSCLGLARFAVLDLGAAFFFLLSLFLTDRYLENPSGGNLVLLSVVCGLSLCVKFTLLPLLLLVPMLFFLSPASKSRGSWWQTWISEFPAAFVPDRLKTTAAFLSICVLVINSVYLFEGFGRLKPPPGPPGVDGGAAASTQLTRLLPASFVSGLRGKFHQAGTGRPAFLFGHWTPRGAWYYFPVTIFLKTPLAFHALLAVLAILLATGRIRWSIRHSRLWLPCLLLLSYLSVFSRINIGLRHVIFIIPACHILLGALADFYKKQAGNRLVKAGGVLVALAYLAPFIYVYPHYLEFFNFAAGGPGAGYKLLIDSNLDWGQDDRLPALWAKKNRAGRIHMLESPMAARTGLFALSANAYQGLYQKKGLGRNHRLPWSWLKKFPVKKRVAYTWFIYEVTVDDFRRWTSLHPDDVWGWLDLGLVLMRRQNIEESYRAFMKADALAPAGRAECLFRLGQLALAAGDPNEAVKRLEQARRLAPSDKKIEHYIELAEADIELLALKEENAPFKDAARVMLRKVRAHGLLREFSACTRYLDILRGEKLDQTPEYWLHSAFFARATGNFETAFENIGKALKMAPDNATIKKAYQLMDHLNFLAQSKNWEQRWREGVELQRLGCYYEAMQAFIAAHELAPAQPRPLWSMGALQISRRLGKTSFTWR